MFAFERDGGMNIWVRFVRSGPKVEFVVSGRGGKKVVRAVLLALVLFALSREKI